jgi:hypothetical protein
MIEECASTSEEVTMPTKRMRTALRPLRCRFGVTCAIQL